MGFLDKAKAAAEQAAASAKEGVDDVQTKRELSQAYGDLGKTTYELIAAETSPIHGSKRSRTRFAASGKRSARTLHRTRRLTDRI